MARNTYIWIALLSFGLGCQGEIGPGARSSGEEIERQREVREPNRPNASCALDVGVTEIRRLSHEQYNHTIRDLFGGNLGEALVIRSTFPETIIEEGFVNDGFANTVNESESNAIEDNAAALAAFLMNDVDGNLPTLMGCVAPPVDDAQIDVCIDEFIPRFGSRAFRRPLADEERALIRDLYDGNRSAGARMAIWAVLEYLFQAPQLIYQIERGAARVAGSDRLVELSDHELATRLSYLLWNSTPDDALLQAANEGRLRSPAGLEEEARRMVADPRVFDSLAVFHRDYGRSYRLQRTPVDDPAFTDEVRDALVQEGRLNLEAAAARDALTIGEIFTNRRYVIHPALADIYGVAPSSEPQEVELQNRRGFLGQASVLATIGAEGQKNRTVMRGLFVLEDVLCQSAGVFPDNLAVSEAIEAASGGATARDRLQPTVDQASCAGCHQQINPGGFALENFDALGRFRTEENGAPIDASGSFALEGADGSFANGTEFLEFIGQSSRARECYVENFFHFAAGRAAAEADACALDQLKSAATDSTDLRELLVQFALSDAFRFRPLVDAAPSDV
ncbi:MAG: DUF1592 domain-containing protein [Myxococcota bacterium]